MDIVKSALVSTLLAIVTVLVVDTYSEIQGAREAYFRTKVSRIVVAASGLETSSSSYFAAAHDAFADKCRGTKRDAIRKYEDDLFDLWKLQLDRVLREAPFLNEVVKRAKKANELMDEKYDECNEREFDAARSEAKAVSMIIVNRLYSHYERCWNQISNRSFVDAVLVKTELTDNRIQSACFNIKH